jgi:hypothetical protein
MNMSYVLVRHKVADYSAWKKVYDAHLPVRQKAGLKENQLLRGANGSNEVVVLFSTNDLERAKEFAESEDLRSTMQKAGVIGRPDVSFFEAG